MMQVIKTNKVVVDSNPVQLNNVGDTTLTNDTNTIRVMGGVVMKTTSNQSVDPYKNNQVVTINMTGV